MANFRDFLRGLAESMPQVVDTLYKYEMYQADLKFKNRELAIEESKAKSMEEYYGAETERTKAATEIDKRRAAVELDTKELENLTAKLAHESALAHRNAIIGFFGSEEGATYYELQQQLKKDALELQKEAVTIDQARSAIRANNAVVRASFLDTVNQFVVDPKAAAFAAGEFEKNGGDYSATFGAMEQAGFKLYPKAVTAAWEGVVDSYAKLGITSATNAVDLRNQIYSNLLNARITKNEGKISTKDIASSSLMADSFAQSIAGMPFGQRVITQVGEIGSMLDEIMGVPSIEKKEPRGVSGDFPKQKSYTYRLLEDTLLSPYRGWQMLGKLGAGAVESGAKKLYGE